MAAVPIPGFATTQGNTVQRAPDGFARHMLASFPSYFTKMLVNTQSTCARGYSLRFLFHLTKNLTAHLTYNLCAVLPKQKRNQNKPKAKPHRKPVQSGSRCGFILSISLLQEKVKRSSEGADERFSKGIFMKKIFKKGYLYYTPQPPICQ